MFRVNKATGNLVGKDPDMALEGGLQEVEGRLPAQALVGSISLGPASADHCIGVLALSLAERLAIRITLSSDKPSFLKRLYKDSIQLRINHYGN